MSATVARRSRASAKTVGAWLAPGPQARRRLAALAAAGAILAAGYLLWLRDSSLVQVRAVTVTGLSGSDARRVSAALGATAKEMTTLHVDDRELERAAAAFPVVRSIEVQPDFPHALRIHVLEHRPAALLASGSRRVAVAADGSVLTGLSVTARLPLLRIAGSLPARQVSTGVALVSLRVAAGVPEALRGRVEEVGREPGKGVVVSLANGPRLIFGNGTRVGAKWAAAVRVLADPDAAGAEYVDVRIPERPAAGGLPVETMAPLAPAEAPAPSLPGPAPEPPLPYPSSSAPPAAAPVDPATAPGGEGPPGPQPQPIEPPAAEGGALAPNPQP